MYNWMKKLVLLNIFKDYHIVAKLSTIAVAYDKWSS